MLISIKTASYFKMKPSYFHLLYVIFYWNRICTIPSRIPAAEAMTPRGASITRFSGIIAQKKSQIPFRKSDSLIII